MLEAKDENGTIAATNAVTCAATGAGASQRPPSPHSDYTRRSGSSRGGEADSAHGSDGVDEEEDNALGRFSTRQSLGPDAVMEPVSSVIQIPEEFYDRLPPSRKVIILVLVSYCAFLAPISSTSVLAATPEVAAEYATNGSIINLVNALYMLFMGVSPILWGPLSQVYGRRLITIVTGVGFLASSIGTALAPNLAAFFVFRILTALEGTSFLLVGSAIISDIYTPVERGAAIGWFMSGTLIGPAFGPFLGGIIVTYRSWRVIFWLQTALAGVALIGAYFLLPETIYHKKIDDLVGYSGTEKTKVLASMINPWRVVRLMRYPNLLLTGLSSSALVWNMYSLLTPIRYVLNPRYNLTTPMQGGLFYLAPGCGYLTGTFFGGRYADHIVKKYIRKRGKRVPEDRLISSLPFIGVVIPTCIMLYGWCVQEDVGGIPLTVVVLFVQGMAQLFCFPSLNTYCLDVMPGRSSEVIAGNYAVRYLFACLGTAVVLPAVESIGVGWFSTISTFFLLAGAAGVALTIRYGERWRDAVGEKKVASRKKVLTEKNAAVCANENLCQDARNGYTNRRAGDQPIPAPADGVQHNKEEV